MLLSEEHHREIIASYSYKSWSPLMELIPLIEKTITFSEPINEIKDENGVKIVPHNNDSDLVSQLYRIVYKIPIIIDFNWRSWYDGLRILKDTDFDFDTIDLQTNCKLITAIVRREKLCEGALAGAFESGQILKILKSIQRQIENNELEQTENLKQ